MKITKESIEKMLAIGTPFAPPGLKEFLTIYKDLIAIDNKNNLDKSIAILEKSINEIEEGINRLPKSVKIILTDVIVIQPIPELYKDMIKDISEDLKESMEFMGIDEILVETDWIAFNMFSSVDNEEVNEIIEHTSEVLKGYNLEIKAVTCF